MGKTGNGNGARLLGVLAAGIIIAVGGAIYSQGNAIASHDTSIDIMQETLRRIEDKLDAALLRQP